ncbi:MAG: creatininase family protein [Fuerstiella sp.]|nr:creatininase family protein [Fuerstiella sp.]
MNDQEICIEKMRPAQVAACRRRADLAFLPLGAIEWHGVHNPLGVDAIKAHHISCMAAAELGGGAVFPALVWGVPRDSFFVNKSSSFGDLSETVAKALETQTQRVRGFSSHGGMDIQEQWLFYQRLLRMSLEQIAGYGFKSVYIVCGHNPLIHWARPVAMAFARAAWAANQPINIDCGGEFDAAGLQISDHGGQWETSITMAIEPDSVDLDELREQQEYQGVGCGDDALEATAGQGREWIETCAGAIARDARRLIDNHPDSANRTNR